MPKLDDTATLQQQAELLCATGFRSTPYLAHFAAAALTCEFALREFDLSSNTVIEVQRLKGAILQEDELNDVRMPAKNCDHQHTSDIEELLVRSEHNLRRSAHAPILLAPLLKVSERFGVRITCGMMEGAEALKDCSEVERPEPRYLGHPKNYWDNQPPAALRDVAEGAQSLYGLFQVVQPDTVINGIRYFLAGEKLHAMTHLHALVELQRLYKQHIVREGLGALALQIELSDMYAPDVPILDAVVVPDIDNALAWQTMSTAEGDLAVPHQVKRFYALHRLMGMEPRIADPIKAASPDIMAGIIVS